MPVNDNLEQLSKHAAENSVPILRHNTACLLSSIASMCKPKEILEIGTAIGYSGLLMLLSCNAKLSTIELDENNANIARKTFASAGVSDRVTLYLGDAFDVISKSTGKYDMIFLDGPKSQYIIYLPYLLQLLNNGGVLVCDNVLFRGLVSELPPKSHPKYTICVKLREFLEKISSNDNLQTTLLDIDDGVSISIYNKEINSF